LGFLDGLKNLEMAGCSRSLGLRGRTGKVIEKGKC
jgi:hypothetical protein